MQILTIVVTQPWAYGVAHIIQAHPHIYGRLGHHRVTETLLRVYPPVRRMWATGRASVN